MSTEADVLGAALRRAYNLGQVYWQQADSEYTSQHRKADETQAKFDALLLETVAALARAVAAEPEQNPAPQAGAAHSVVSIMRAMGKNYSGRHVWDKLDAAACCLAADEIERLRATEQPRQDVLAQPVAAEPFTYLVERSAFRVSPHGQDAESNEWLEEAKPDEPGAFPVYRHPPPTPA